METKFTKLISEDRHLIEAFAANDEQPKRGKYIYRLFLQENGRVSILLSLKQANSTEDIIFRAEDLENESHAEALLVVSKNIYTRYGLGHGTSYKLLSFFDRTSIKVVSGIIIGLLIANIF